MTELIEIPARRVVRGLYLNSLQLSWWRHDFLRQQFLLDSDADVERVRQLGEHLVQIDMQRSEGDAAASFRSEPAPTTGDPPPPREASPDTAVAGDAMPRSPVSRDGELPVARKLVQRARQAVEEAMREARAGRLADLGGTAEVAEGLVLSMARNPAALLSLAALKTRDDYTFTHCVAVGGLMVALGQRLGLPADELRAVGQAGLLHDLGKAAIPLEILNKPGKLTPAEFDIVREHSRLGDELARQCGIAHPVVLDVVLHHHERVDGRGYPFGLAGEQLSLHARMAAVCDVYDAVTSNRVYHRGIAPTAALQLLLKDVDRHFDARVVRALVQTLGIYPALSVVRLKSGRLAVVLEQCAGDISRPLVRVFYSCKSAMRVLPYDVRLIDANDSIDASVDPADYELPANTAAAVAGVAG